jgi:hypothetical protein
MQTKNQTKTSNTIYLYFSENQSNNQIQSIVTLINKSYEDDQIKTIKKKYFLQSSVKEKKHKIKTKLEMKIVFVLHLLKEKT